MELLVEVNENDIVRVKEGDTAVIEVDAYLDREFKGIVTQIANSAQTKGMSTDQVTNFEVKILILKDSYQDLLGEGNLKPFLPGMSASADIMTEKKNGILSLPIQAVTTRLDTLEAADSVTSERESDTPKEIVFLYDNGKAVQKEIKSGIQDNNFIEIKEGLKDSVEVIVAPYDVIAKKLEDGTLVNKVKEENLYKKKRKQ
jgi:HlyD family secretion protein